MELQIERLAGNITRAVPIGRWDVTGAAAIDLRLSAIAGSGRPVIMDMTQVSFLSSMGIRSIVMSAKAITLRGAKMVLLSPDANVEMVLTTAGIDMLVPIYREIEAASLAVIAG